ncbi:aspartate/glutamate racemase family protein [Streptomyces sp. H27-C3]|uniref:aspartate/glutamate racemase family protein n=1 Tax=Streptomyces sp. H27-C3 TaxID=3046305 RepID=UPI0024B998D3|nr:aspartate/glutamate racemase family protein [Streptomyces sp. H27-C3]MDJ0465282.1 aspartate/glutamate racemase family protein [Streptomyces sp. H27-C3]
MLTLLHTSPVHGPVFDALRDRHHPGLGLRHLVYEDLLAAARSEGPGAIDSALAAVLTEAVTDGATAVLCTCSTIGGAAQAHTARLGVPVLRVDRPMAAAAVAAAPERGTVRIAVVAALRSTLAPTTDLIREEAAAAGRRVDIRAVSAGGAWERFESGDRDGYLDSVARSVDGITGADVVVLAQASMADAADRTGTALPVLSSPAPGLRAAVAAAGDAERSAQDV